MRAYQHRTEGLFPSSLLGAERLGVHTPQAEGRGAYQSPPQRDFKEYIRFDLSSLWQERLCEK